MPARILVEYATKLGSTREIAEIIARELRAAGHDAEALSLGDAPAPDRYDALVLGSSLYAAHWRREANRYVARHRAALAARPVWLFSSGPLDAELGAANLPITPRVAALTAPIRPREHRTFGGRLLPDAPVEPQVLATHPVGDFRDVSAIRAWAREIATALASEPARP